MVTGALPLMSPERRIGALTPRVRASVADNSIWFSLRRGPKIETLAMMRGLPVFGLTGPTRLRRVSETYWPGCESSSSR